MRIFMSSDPQRSERGPFQTVLGSLSALSNDYCIALNVNLPTEIDLLVCSPKSIIVMEVKAWVTARPMKAGGGAAGADFFHAAHWEHDGMSAEVQPNPMRAVRDKTNALGDLLEREILKVKLPCFPILIFPNMAEPPEGLKLPDGFGKVFFMRDLSERLAEFISNTRFANANPAKFPIAANYQLTVADIRDKIIPPSFEERPYGADLFESRHSAPQIVNNFQFAGPVTGNRFRGMDAPLRNIQSKLRSHLYICGMRRMGKSSLLKRIEEFRMGGIPPYDKTDLVFLDFFSDITDDDARSIYESILFQLCVKLPLSDISALGIGRADKDLRANLRRRLRNPVDFGFNADIDGTRRLFEHLALETLRAYRSQHPSRRAILVFDEFSDVLLRCWRPEAAGAGAPADGSVRFSQRDIRFLGALLKNPAFSEACSMVVIGKPYMLDLDRRMKTELFSVMSRIQIDFLKEAELKDLVVSLARPVGFSDEALGLIWWATAGHPFYAQLLSNIVMSHASDPRRAITEDDVKDGMKELLQDNSKFEFQLTDYSVETLDDGARSFYKLTTPKVAACLSSCLQQNRQDECPEAELLKACARHMHVDERAADKTINGLLDAHVLVSRQADGQNLIGYRVPLLHLWACHQKLFEKCKRLA